MSAFLILRALLFAGECLLASVALPLAGFAITALLRRAALRHLVWTTLFGVLAVLPLVAWLMPPRLIVRHVAAMPVQAVTEAVAVPTAAAAPLPPDLLAPGNIVALLLTLWLAGLFWQVLRLALGGIGLRRLAKASTPFASEIETGCAIRLARDESGPATFGLLRPLVLLPRSAEHWPAARLEAVLRHEAAHVARRDVLSQLIARLVCAVFWINPLLWLGYGALRRQAEIAADDAVVAGGMTPSLYAIELVRLAGESLRPVPGIAMARPPLTKRVEAVLAENSLRKGVTKMDMAKMGLLGLTATLLLGAARFDLAVARDVAPQVEKNAALHDGKDMAAQARARADALKAKADAVSQTARARAEAETDPAKKEAYRREAEQVAAQADRMKAEADRMAADAARALAHTEEARKAAQDVAARQIWRAMKDTGNPADAVAAAKSLAALEEAERAARDVEMTETRDVLRRAAADRMNMQEAQQRLAQARELAGADARRARDMADPLARGGLTIRGIAGGEAAGGYSFVRTAGLQETVAKALADAHLGGAVTKALEDAHISETIARAIAQAQAPIRFERAPSPAIAPLPGISPPPVPPAPRALPPVPALPN
jgi:beta-lactamase regulating signal transducer with metallopeptidase domain